LRDVETLPGILLVSDDPAALVPVAIALEGHVRVRAMSVAAACASSFPAQVLVLHASERFEAPALSELSARFPRAAIVRANQEPVKSLDRTLDEISARLGDGVPRNTLPYVVVAAIEVMVRHCRDPLTIDEIARTIGVSTDHLIRVFHEAFDLTAGAYYVRLRIAVACRLLSDTNEKMEDIAIQVGYSGAANMSRAFKEVMGIRPGEFRCSSASSDA